MPSKSFRQARFMVGIAHGMKPKSGHGPSVSVAREYVRADSKSGMLKCAMRSTRRSMRTARSSRRK